VRDGGGGQERKRRWEEKRRRKGDEGREREGRAGEERKGEGKRSSIVSVQSIHEILKSHLWICLDFKMVITQVALHPELEDGC
jgi:hypothetical protein